MKRTAHRFGIQHLLVLSLILLTGQVGVGCSDRAASDAYGQFEAIETTISAESNGRLVSYRVSEGRQLARGERVGMVDTTRLALQREELKARIAAVEARNAGIEAETEVLREEHTLASANLRRVEKMEEEGAATRQQLDEARTRAGMLQKKIEALQIQKRTVRAEIRTIEANLAQLDEQVRDAIIVNPVAGTVLTNYVEPHELVRPGQPLYRIAALDTLILRAYVDGGQLPAIGLGDRVEVLVDRDAERNHKLTGRISWIASEAEFTPQQIQTKEERVTQVYAMKIRVANPEGLIKIGMPGEVNFGGGTSSQPNTR